MTKDSVSSFNLPEIRDFLNNAEMVSATRDLYEEGSYTRQSAAFGFDVKSALSLVDTELAATASDGYQKLSVNRPKPYFNFF